MDVPRVPGEKLPTDDDGNYNLSCRHRLQATALVGRSRPISEGDLSKRHKSLRHRGDRLLRPRKRAFRAPNHPRGLSFTCGLRDRPSRLGRRRSMWWCDHLGRKRRSTSYKRRLRSARAAAAAAASRGRLPPGETTASRRKCCASALRWPRLLPRAAPSMPLGKCRPCAAAAPRWPHLGRRPQAWRQAPRRAPRVPAAPRRRRVERLSRRIRNAGMCCATQAARAHHAPPTSPLPSEPTPRTRSVAERACSTHLGALAAEPARYMASHMACYTVHPRYFL